MPFCQFEARQFEQRVAREILFGNSGHVTHHMRGNLSIGIVTRLADIDTNSWQIRRVDFDPAHFFPLQVFPHGNRDESPAAARFPEDTAAIVLADFYDGIQTRECLFDIERLLRYHHHTIILNINGQSKRCAGQRYGRVVGPEAAG